MRQPGEGGGRDGNVAALFQPGVPGNAEAADLGDFLATQSGCAAAERLPFQDAVFDVVLCRFTTHHWQNMEAGLREARRVLKPNGRAIFIDTVVPADRTLDTHIQAVELLRDVSHVRNYSVAEWVAAFGRSGFAIEGITMRTLRMEFAVWTARTRTPAVQVEAIRALQVSAPPGVRAHFAIGEDGSFDLEAATMVVQASG